MTQAKDYLAGGPAYLYPGAGDPHPPGGTKVLLLTEGGVCVVGTWAPGMVGWSHLPSRDKLKESKL